MIVTDAEIRKRLGLGEDSDWEFQQLEFEGARLKGPGRDDLADEMIAFANSDGGTLLCGVIDAGEIQGLSREQIAAANKLIGEIGSDTVKPDLNVKIRHRELDGKAFLLVEVPRGKAVHERRGRAFIRQGASVRPLDGDARLRLARERAQGRCLWFDMQVVPDTGFETLDQRLWEPLLGATAAVDPPRALRNLRLLADDDLGTQRATVAGVLLCTQAPHELLPQATIAATCYRGEDRASGQLDAQEIMGPLPVQIADAVKFVVRNMRVAAIKIPERVDVPQYAATAVFEAIVNAVVHRDYSMSARRIRVSMFGDRLEIDSPGRLPNGLTVEGMRDSQSVRNEALASVFARMPTTGVPGADDRRYVMERRGDGVSIIFRDTLAATGVEPEYEVVDESNLVLTIPAAKLDPTPATARVAVTSNGAPVPGVDVLALFPNGTWQQAASDAAGEALLNLHATHLPMTVYAAAEGYAAAASRDWKPDAGDLGLELAPLPDGGAAIFPLGTGNLPGVKGRLNPILDASGRTYMYADNISIDEGRPQPATFRFGKPMRLTDAFGVELSATVVGMVGRCALVEYRPFER